MYCVHGCSWCCALNGLPSETTSGYSCYSHTALPTPGTLSSSFVKASCVIVGTSPARSTTTWTAGPGQVAGSTLWLGAQNSSALQARPLLQTSCNMFKQAALRRGVLFSHRICEGSFVLLLFLILVFFSGTIHF